MTRCNARCCRGVIPARVSEPVPTRFSLRHETYGFLAWGAVMLAAAFLI